MDGIATRAIVNLHFVFDKGDQRVGVRPTSHQRGERLGPSGPSGMVQRCETTGIPSINIRPRINKGIDDSNIFVGHPPVQRGVAVDVGALDKRRADSAIDHFDPRAVPDQGRHNGRIVLLGRVVQRGSETHPRSSMNVRAALD